MLKKPKIITNRIIDANIRAVFHADKKVVSFG